MRRVSAPEMRLPGGTSLSFPAQGAGFGVQVRLDGQVAARAESPAAVMVFKDGHTSWERVPYDSVRPRRGGLTARAELSVGSSRLAIVDHYRAGRDHFRLQRRVRVRGDSPGCGFLSAVEWDLGSSMEDPWFAPAVWYGSNDRVPPYAIGSPSSRRGAAQAMIREDRLPLPFMLHWDEPGHALFSMAHVRARGATVAADDEDEPLVDPRLSFGSIGLDHGGRVLAFWFPGSEAEVSYPPLWTLGRGNRQQDSPVNPLSGKRSRADSRARSLRLHPMRRSFRARFELRIDCRKAESFDDACDSQWRLVSAEYRPRVRRVPLDRIERSSVALLRRTVVQAGSAMGIPTWLDCFGGRPGQLQNTFGIGFVCRNIEAAQLMIEYGWSRRDPPLRELGAAILDFWVRESGPGLSHTEYDPGSGRWVDSEDGGAPCVFLRDQSESRRACLEAWTAERGHGTPRPQWLAWAASYGDWLASHQEGDGSFHRAYRRDGTPTSQEPADSIHVVPFLLALDAARGTTTGMAIALSVARFCRRELHGRRIYAGATLDNPNCTDKESAALAFEAYLLLYEATSDRSWLSAAEEAARTCETWMFEWDVPMPVDDPQRFFPAGRGTTGFQVITAGFSAFDMYLARHAGDFARLARHTGDAHYRRVAEILLHNTKAAVQRRGELGYARPGMQIEHWSLGRGRGYGLNSGWLPWVTTSHLVSIRAARRDF